MTRKRHSGNMGAPLTKEEYLDSGKKGIEFEKPVRRLECCKCHRLGGTLVKVGVNEYKHLECK